MLHHSQIIPHQPDCELPLTTIKMHQLVILNSFDDELMNSTKPQHIQAHQSRMTFRDHFSVSIRFLSTYSESIHFLHSSRISYIHYPTKPGNFETTKNRLMSSSTELQQAELKTHYWLIAFHSPLLCPFCVLPGRSKWLGMQHHVGIEGNHLHGCMQTYSKPRIRLFLQRLSLLLHAIHLQL